MHRRPRWTYQIARLLFRYYTRRRVWLRMTADGTFEVL